MSKKYILLFLVFVFVLTGCSVYQSQNGNTVPVVKVIDGDTIKVKLNGKEENIRFLLIDTPETNHPRLDGPQPFGEEAKQFTKEMISKTNTVELELDVSERDKYGRILAYVYVDGVSVQEELLKNGLARVAYIYPPNTKYVDRYQKIQEEAQMKGLGIWSIENYATDSGFNQKQNEEKKNIKANENGCTIKGNINSKGDKIYHTIDSPWYEKTIAEAWFCTEKEAMEAGFRAPK